MNAKPKVENGYHRFFFDEYAEKDTNLVQATRNHPSIVIEVARKRTKTPPTTFCHGI
jgi:hypothetical protein